MKTSSTTPTNSPKSSPHSQHLSSPTHFTSPTSNYHTTPVLQSSTSPSSSPTTGTTTINNNNTNLLNNNNSLSNVYQKYTTTESQPQIHHQQQQQQHQQHQQQSHPMTIVHTLQHPQQMFNNQQQQPPSSPINLHQSPEQHLLSGSPHHRQDHQFSPIHSPANNGAYFYDTAASTTMENQVKIEPQTQQTHIVYTNHMIPHSVSHSPSSIEDEYDCHPHAQNYLNNQNLFIQNLSELDRRHFDRRNGVKLE